MSDAEFSQLEMVHRLPPAPLVDRFSYLRELARGRRVVHVGFVDAGCQTMNVQSGVWLHEHLASTATELVGIDLDEGGVADARTRGYEAYAVDCRDDAAIRALDLTPADLVVAGEVIEHVDDPGGFLDGLHTLVAPGGMLTVTTPNATGLVNAAALLGNLEVSHPDHVVMFSCATLDAMLVRHGWQPVEHAVFTHQVKSTGTDTRSRALATGARVVLGLERLLARLGRPYAADGLIVTARATPV